MIKGVTKSKLYNLYIKQKLPGTEISKLLGIKSATIYKYLHKCKIPLRDARFKIGYNVWATLSPEKIIQRKASFRKRMLKYNPMKDPLIAQKVSLANSQNNLGSDNPNFKHGRYSFTKVGLLGYRKAHRLKAKIGKCEKCGIKRPLLVHHKDNNKLNNNPDNLQVLCYNCHYLIHYP